jgi:5-methyltetrahydropteroyltriglutamate--homocysteine methyltransferase
VFRHVTLPPGKVLIPGVIDSTTNYIEHPDLVALRIEQLAALVGRERIIAGVDCGFATSAGSSRVDADVAWAKLGSLARGAETASRHLWGC